MRFFCCLLGIIISSFGCTSTSQPLIKTVNPGENVSFEYICKTSDGKLAATSDRTVIENTVQAPSPLFAPLNNYLPPCEEVPIPQQNKPLHPKMPFEEMLEKLIANQSANAPYNTAQNITIAGELVPGISESDRYLILNRTYKKNRHETIPIKSFEEIYGITPIIGVKYDSPQPGISATVENIEDDNVTILTSAEPGTVLSSHFGRQVVIQTGDNLEFRTDAVVGDIIRSGGMIGKVSKVDNDTIEIDYGHSSGFLPLTCKVVYKPCSSPDGLNWHENLDQAKEESRQTGKPLLVHFHDQWSKPGRELLARILPEPSIIDAMNRYVRVRINVTSQPELTKLYKVTTVPTIQLYNNQGTLKSTISSLPKVKKLEEELLKVEADTK